MRKSLCAGWLGLALLTGCQSPAPDVAGDAARLTGVENAIVFRENADSLDAAPLADAVLTPAQAVRLALLHDPRLQTSLAQVRVAQADATQARLLPNPILVIDIRFPKSGPATAFEATLTGDLVALLQKPPQIAAADKRLRASAQAALTTALDTISEVQEAYVSASSIDAEIVNAQRRDEILRRLHDLAQKRLDAGDATRLDLLTLDSQVMQSELDLSDLRLSRFQERLKLARLIGQPRSDANWQLSPWEAPAATVAAPESVWIDAALANRPEIAARMWELKALGDDLAVAEFSPLLPDEAGAHLEHDGPWRIGPTISAPLPIFDFGQATRDKVKAQRVAARHELEQQQLEVIEDIRAAYATYLQTLETLSGMQEKLLPIQRQEFEQAQRAYQSGDTDVGTLLMAQSDLELTLSKILELQEKVTVARVKLERAAGGAGVADRLEAQAATQPATHAANITPMPVPDISTSRPATGTER